MKGNKHSKNFLLQSAMEYLMTYGWAILILAIVLGALFQLGVFNASSYSPRAQPGSCKVQRVNIPGSTIASLAGTCNGQLPQYVAKFNGQNSYITAGTTWGNLVNGAAGFTIAAWMNPNTLIMWSGIQFNNTSCWYSADLRLGPSNQYQLSIPYSGCNAWRAASAPTAAQTNKWTFVVGTYTAGCITLYLNGALVNQVCDSNGQPSAADAKVNVGWYNDKIGTTAYFNGYISNVQIYNASLPASDVNKLYLEGIGGAPIDLAYLTGWWQLNGDTNDYSGNNNNGVPAGVSFMSQYGK